MGLDLFNAWEPADSAGGLRRAVEGFFACSEMVLFGKVQCRTTCAELVD
jgi:hypothetical protein